MLYFAFRLEVCCCKSVQSFESIFKGKDENRIDEVIDSDSSQVGGGGIADRAVDFI